MKLLNDLLHRRQASSAMLSFLLKTADLAVWLHGSFTHDLPQGGRSGSFLRKANLSTKGGSDISITRKREKLLRKQKVARSGKSCSKYQKLLKSCRATCGKPYLGL